MNVGDQKTFSAHARSFWHDSGVDLIEGASYYFCVRGIWIDFYIPCGPDGYEGRAIQRKLGPSLRMPGAKWFALCGALNRNQEAAFVIGETCLYRATAAGRLYCFTNDVPGWYWNNFRSLRVKVARVS